MRVTAVSASAAARRAPRRARAARGGRASPRAASRRGQPAVARSARGARRARAAIAVDVVRRRDDAGAGLADQLRGRAVGRHDARGSAARPRGTRRPCRRGRPCRGRPPRGSAAAAPPSRAGARASAGAARTGSARAGRRARALSAHSRSAGAEVAEEARRRRRGRTRASAVRNGRGSRLPKKLPACVIRKPLAGRVLEPGEVVEVGAVRDRHDLARRAEARAPRRRSRRRRTTIASAERATSRATPLVDLAPSRARPALSARRCGCATSESRRSATQARPSPASTAAPTRWTELGGEVVITTSIPSSRTIRIAAGIAVRFQLTFSSGHEQPARGELAPARARARAPPCRAAPRPACAPFGPEVARAVHPRLRRRRRSSSRWIHFGSSGASTCVSIPSAGRYWRELERPLHAAAARRREVERDEQHLHARRSYSAPCVRLRDRVERVAVVAVDTVEVGRDLEAVAVEHEPVGAVRCGIAGRRSRGSSASSRRSYGRFSFVSATCAGGADGDVDRREGGDPVARLRVARRRRRPRGTRVAQRLDEPGRERARRRRVAGVQSRRRATATGSTKSAAAPGDERRRPLDGGPPPEPAGERERGAADDARSTSRAPGRRPRAVAEVARVGELERRCPPTSATGRSRRRASAASTASPPANANANGTEAGGAPRLRERDEVGEGREEQRHEHQREHRERAAEHERAPSAGASASAGERDEQRAPRPRPRRRGRRPPARAGSSCRRRRRAGPRTGGSARCTLGRVRGVRGRVADDGQQPERGTRPPAARAPRARAASGATRAARRASARARKPPSGSQRKSA